MIADMANLPPEKRIVAGASVEEALRAFRENVNQPGTTFSRDPWLLPKLDQLRKLLSDPITHTQAHVLLEVLYDRCPMRDLLGWLEAPGIDWWVYPTYRSFMEEKQQREREAERDRMAAEVPALSIFQESPEARAARIERDRECAKKDYLPKAKPCPQCGKPPELLEWDRKPMELLKARCSYSGWRTRCPSCQLEVDFFKTAHWTRGLLTICHGVSSAVH